MAQGILSQRYSLYYQRASMLYQRPEIKASLEIILSVFTVMILILFAIRPTVTNIFALQKKIEDLTVLEKKSDNKVAQLIAASKQINDFGDQLNLYDMAVPEKYTYFEIAKRLDILARSNNVVLDKVSFPGGWLAGDKSMVGFDVEKAKKFTAADSNGLTTISVSFTSSGSQRDTINFLTAIENMDRLSLIKSISIIRISKSALQTTSGLKTDGQIDFYSYQKP